MSKNALARALGRRFSAEDDTPTDDLPVEQVEEIGETPDAAVAEVTEAEGEVVAEVEVMDKQQDAADSLESIYLAIQAAAGEGGLQPGEAAAIHGWTRSIVGQEAFAIAMPSLESYGGTTGRMSATNASLEGVGQMLKDIWAAIMRQIRKIIASVRNWYLKVVDSAPRLKKRAEAIKDRAGDVTGSPEKNKIDLGLVRQLHLDQKVPSKSQVLAGAAKVEAVCTAALTGKTEKTYEDTENKLIELMEGDGNVAAAKKEVLQDGKSDAGAWIQAYGASQSVSGDRFGAETDAKLTEPMLGGKAILVKLATKDDGKLKHFIANTGVELVTHADKPKDLDGTGSFDTLGTADVNKLCDHVIKICDDVIAYKKLWQARENRANAMDAAAKKAISNVEKDKEAASGAAGDARDAMGSLNSMYANAVRFQSSLISYGIKSSQALLSYCEKSLAQYKTK